jgi:hypothetical protein
MLKSSFRTPCIGHAPCATTLSHICEKLRNFCPPDEYFSQLVPPMLSFHTAKKVPGEAHKKVPDNILLLRGHRCYKSFDRFCFHVVDNGGVN